MSEYASDFLDTFKFHSDKNMPQAHFQKKIDRPRHGPAITRYRWWSKHESYAAWLI